MDVDILRTKGGNPSDVRRACVSGFSLRIGKRAWLAPDPDSSVYGLIMKLSNAEVDKLYLEESVRAYRPEAVLAQLENGSYVPALCFNLESGDETDPEYLAKLRDLARRLELPANYVEGIR